MKLSVNAFAVALGLVWGSCVFVVGLLNIIIPTFGLSFLWLVSSVSPGFHAEPNVGSVFVGTAYAVLEGALAGTVLANVYNLLVKFEKK